MNKDKSTASKLLQINGITINGASLKVEGWVSDESKEVSSETYVCGYVAADMRPVKSMEICSDFVKVSRIFAGCLGCSC